MIAKKIVLACFLPLFLMTTPSDVYSQTIKDTKKFLDYFHGIDNMVSYKKLKQTIEATGGQIQMSTSIAENDKTKLMEFYNFVKAKADSLVEKITGDLLSKSERKQMVKDPNAYVISLNGIFGDIRTANINFNNNYTAVVGPTRGRTFSLQVNNFELPLDKAFGDELITALLKNLIQTQLKKKISLKAWDDL